MFLLRKNLSVRSVIVACFRFNWRENIIFVDSTTFLL